MHLCICQIVSYCKGKVYASFKVLLCIAKHALWKDLPTYLKIWFNVLFHCKASVPRLGAEAGWRQGEKSVVWPVTLFPEHCWVHRPDGHVRFCQGLIEPVESQGASWCQVRWKCFPDSSPGWLTLDLGTFGFWTVMCQSMHKLTHHKKCRYRKLSKSMMCTCLKYYLLQAPVQCFLVPAMVALCLRCSRAGPVQYTPCCCLRGAGGSMHGRPCRPDMASAVLIIAWYHMMSE